MPQFGCSNLMVGWLRPPVIDLLREHGLNVFATDELGRNQLHIALAPWVAPKVEAIEYLIKAGVPLNTRDHGGKTQLAYWREPRDFEIHWFRAWLIERLVLRWGYRSEKDAETQLQACGQRDAPHRTGAMDLPDHQTP